MKLSTRIRYGSRALVELSKVFPNSTISISELAKLQELSPKYLEQIMIPLRGAGIVSAIRGKQGGYQLTKSPELLTLFEIYQVLEGPLAPVHCVLNPHDCSRYYICPTWAVWKEITDAIKEILVKTTLAKLMNRAGATLVE